MGVAPSAVAGGLRVRLSAGQCGSAGGDELARLPWRWLFGLSITSALISSIIRYRVKGTEVWKPQTAVAHQDPNPGDVLGNPAIVRRFVYLVLLMTVNRMSHGTQDVHRPSRPRLPDHGASLSSLTARWIVVIYNIGAIIWVWRHAVPARFSRCYTIVFCAGADR